MALACTVISRRQFTINHWAPGSFRYSFDWPNLETTLWFWIRNPWIGNLQIYKQLIHYSFIIAKKCIKYLKYLTYLHPIKASDYSKNVSSCHILIWPLPPSFKKNSPHSKLKHPSRNIFQLPLLSSGISNS